MENTEFWETNISFSLSVCKSGESLISYKSALKTIGLIDTGNLSRFFLQWCAVVEG